MIEAARLPRTARLPKLPVIDCFRGVAALLVVLFHSELTVARAKYFGFDALHGLFRFGGHGVDFFFVLSGFIIAYAHWDDIGSSRSVSVYLRKRLVRIYPPLWAAAIPLIVASILIHSEFMPTDSGGRLKVIAGTLLLVPTSLPPVPVVVWTLKHEILFYLLFALVLIRPKAGFTALILWGMACVYYAFTPQDGSFITDFLLSSYNLEFLTGIACCAAIRRIKLPAPGLLALAGAAIFVVAAHVANGFEATSHPGLWRGLETSGSLIALFAASSACLIVWAARIDQEKAPKWLLTLGAASYSIYLVHFGVISMTCKALLTLNRHMTLPAIAPFLIAAVSGTSVGLLFHFYVEMPLVKWAGAKWRPAPTTSIA